MIGKVFISYPRDDTASFARRVYERLVQEFGGDALFMDVYAIPLGTNFVKVIDETVAKCDVLLAIIGPGWLGARDERGKRRLDNPHDFVRIEIAAALKRDIPIVPILVEGAPFPKASQLPKNIRGLALQSGLTATSFQADMDKLILFLALQGGKPTPAAATAAYRIRSVINQLIQMLRGQAAAPTAASREERLRIEGRIKVDAGIVHDAPDGWFKPGAGKAEWFKDHPHGPEMVVVPAGSFMMGSPESERGRRSNEDQHKVTFARPFAVGRFPVTFGEWDEGQPSWRSGYPVTDVSWDDAKAYVARLSKQTGKPYRLLSEAEWEYAARAGTTTPFWWGNSISTEQAQYDNRDESKAIRDTRRHTTAVKSFKPNPWGLYQVHGNVFEWTEDCWNETYSGAPSDGSAWTTGDCNSHVIRGGSFLQDEDHIRSAYRRECTTVDGFNGVGFRVARTLLP